MRIEETLQNSIANVLKQLYGIDAEVNTITLQKTKKEFTGDLTLVVFPFVKAARKSPEAVANEIGAAVAENCPAVASFNAIKGFLNFEINKDYWVDFVLQNADAEKYGFKTADSNQAPIVVEYSSPNTNKPLHLGHIRNNLLGWSVSELLKADGNNVKKVNLVNDRGIHICKSMLAWLKYGNGETPESSGMKGDHLVGKYYVLFDKHYKEQIKELVETKGIDEEEAAKTAPLMLEAQEMLRKWEAKDPEVYSLWEKMNGWVYSGFDVTYKRLGIDFDKIYYESQTYLLGKETVMKGLQDGVLFRKEDGSVWADLTGDGLDQKLLLRKDGTSVYMTQDLGTAQLRQKDYNAEKLMYVVGNEQDYHFTVLKLILGKLGFEWGKKIHHLSYGMVELPNGKMKSREGTVVDADDLIDEMVATAEQTSKEKGRSDEGTDPQEQAHLYYILAMGALKYFILKVDPQKNMLFNPQESIDFNGNTGPFIQYTHARIRSIIRKSQEQLHVDLSHNPDTASVELNDKEREIVKILHDAPAIIDQAAQNYSPAMIANYVYDLAKSFNSFYQDTPILREENANVLKFRLKLCDFVAKVIKNMMGILGIEVPEKM